MDDLRLLYGWVKRTREILFEYTDALPPDVYTLEREDFAYGSIGNIHAHVAGCYFFWVGQFGLGRDWASLGFDDQGVTSSAQMRAKFLEVDAMLEEAFTTFTRPDDPFEIVRPGQGAVMVSQRWLVMHPITHEFHHKGQLLALGRVLKHPLPERLDTDLVLP